VTTNPRPAGMTVPDGPVESDFYIHKMAGQNEFYNTLEETGEGSTVIIHWKTNLKSEDFFLYNETTNKPAGGNFSIARDRYGRTDDDIGNGGAVKINDGYAFAITEKKPGTYKYSVSVSGPNGDEKIGYNTTATVTFKDYRTAENQALDALISRSGAASKNTVKDKLVALADYMANTGWEKGSFIHPGNAEEGEYANTYGDYRVWFQSRVITCLGATKIIQKCASIFGVPDSGIKAENPDKNNPHHVRLLITYKGDTFWVDGSPLTDIR
jgi:hypothetical protein